MLFGEEASPPLLPTRLETSGAVDKRCRANCNLLTNRALPERVRILVVDPEQRLRLTSIPEYLVLLGKVARSTIIEN